jgi:serine/threonine protein kinase
MHSKNVLFRNLTPENIYIDLDGHLKLNDFTNAKKLAFDRTYTMIGFQSYTAPEQLIGNGHTKLADWWAFGILIFHLLTGILPFEASSPLDAYFNMIQSTINLPDYFDPSAADIIRKLICPDPRKRLGFGDNGVRKIKEQPWFNGVDFNLVTAKRIPPPWMPLEDVNYYTCSEDLSSLSEGGEEEYVEFLM